VRYDKYIQVILIVQAGVVLYLFLPGGLSGIHTIYADNAFFVTTDVSEYQ